MIFVITYTVVYVYYLCMSLYISFFCWFVIVFVCRLLTNLVLVDFGALSVCALVLSLTEVFDVLN